MGVGPVDQWKIACFASRRPWVQIPSGPFDFPRKSPTSTKKLVGKDVDINNVNYRLHCLYNGTHTQPGRDRLHM